MWVWNDVCDDGAPNGRARLNDNPLEIAVDPCP